MWWTTPAEMFKDMIMFKLDQARQAIKAGSSDHQALIEEADLLGMKMGKLTNEIRHITRNLSKAPKMRAYHAPVMDLSIPLHLFSKQKAEPGVILGTVIINGVLFHAEAIEVTYENKIQEAAIPDGEGFLNDLPYMDEAFQTIEHEGKQYVLHIFPHKV